MRFILCIALFLPLSLIRAQSLANYSSARNTSATYTSINVMGSAFASWRSTATTAQDDNRSGFTNIGFDFWYDGTRYTQFCVSTNGFLDFSSSTADGTQASAFGYQNTAFTAANAANATRPAIAPFYDDLTAQGGTAALGNSIKYYLQGSAPSRTLVVEWINMAVYNNTSPSLNFQVKLLETTGQIIIHYGTMNAGTNLFSYSMGLNGPTVSLIPTAAQLKALQTVNTNTFSQTTQNALSTMPTSASQYIFTPPTPANPTGSLTFSGTGQTAVTLNWSNWASNEVGYVIYNSTDGINYSFVAQTAANAVSYTASGLLPSTTYYWQVYAVTEGYLSSALTGSQTTTAAGNKISNTSGNWNTASIWTPTGVPTAADNVTIAATHTISINASGACNNLVVGQGTGSTLQFSGGGVKTLSVNNNVTINNGAAFTTLINSNATHSVTLGGNLVNNGTLNFQADANSLVDVVFNNNGNQTISGTGATNTFNRINMSLGTSVTNTLEITSSNFVAASNFLDLNAGTLKLSTINAVNVVPYTAAATVSANGRLYLNSANVVVTTSAGVTLYGDITIANGTLNIGNAADEDLIFNGGSIGISNGVLNIAGKLDGSGLNNVCDFDISGGTVVVPTVGSSNTTIAPFHIASAGSQCNMTGGLIVIQREGGTGTQHLGFINNNTSGAIVTGGTLQIGNASTPAGQVMGVNSDTQVQNLLVNSANATASISTNPLVVIDKVTIASGTLNAAAMSMSVGGNWSNSGTFTSGTSTVNFNGTSAQSIYKTSAETFYALQFSGSGAKTFSTSITANSNFSVASGASVDVSPSNYSVILKGNFTNNGNFNAESGLVTFSGTAAQSIGGTSTTNFYNLTLTNAAGASLNNAENLKGTLTLSGGTLSANGQVFTMISDTNNTARIAQITGTGDYSGNVTIQRFAPGGYTGWALLGSPISSSLTLNDWDDDIFISCPTCPDGSAGGFLSIYTYDETASGAYDSPASYIPLSTINDPIISGKGYWVYLGTGSVTTANITLDLTGTPRKFNYSIPLSYTNYGSTANDGWNLITNPYPSAISWASLKGSTANIDNAIYVYNADLSGGSGGFASYVNGISSPAVGSGGVGDAIPMGQGFYVHSTGATSLNGQESIKVATNPTFLRPNNAGNGQALMRLLLQGANAYMDETVLYYEPNATPAFDYGYDAYKMRGQDPNAASIALENGTDVFQINGISPVAGNFTMPLKTLTGISGAFTITADNIGSFPADACITLYDKYTSVTTDLKTSSYVFNLDDTTSISRFLLNITLNQLAVNGQMLQPSCTAPNNGKIVASGNSAGPWNYYWTSNGTPVRTKLNKATADTLNNLSGGNYELSIHTVGMCDNGQSNYVINPQTPAMAAFTSVDTVYLDQSSSIQFTATSANNNFFWNFGTGLDFAFAATPVMTYHYPGKYQVSLVATSSTGCKDTVSKIITVVSGITGIASQGASAKEFLVKSLDNNRYEIQADFDNALSFHTQLTDVNGKSVMDYGTVTTQTLNLDINLDTYAKGLYFLTITSSSNKKVVKLPVK